MQKQGEQGSLTKVIVGAIVIGLLLVVLLSFHFVFRGGSPVAVIPKSSLTFRLSFVTVNGVIDRWNNEMNLLKMSSDKLFVNLVEAMERKELIKRENSS